MELGEIMVFYAVCIKQINRIYYVIILQCSKDFGLSITKFTLHTPSEFQIEKELRNSAYRH